MDNSTVMRVGERDCNLLTHDRRFSGRWSLASSPLVKLGAFDVFTGNVDSVPHLARPVDLYDVRVVKTAPTSLLRAQMSRPELDPFFRRYTV